MDWHAFSALLARFAKASDVQPSDVLFRSGLDIPSIAFTEFVMELEDEAGMDIDLNALDESIVTAGQLYERIFEQSAG